jgi:hypothetical protein
MATPYWGSSGTIVIYGITLFYQTIYNNKAYTSKILKILKNLIEKSIYFTIEMTNYNC